MSQPTLIFGSGNLGLSFSTPDKAAELLQLLQSKGISHIDTARRYPALHPGLSETLLGQANAAERGFIVDTKIKVTPENGPEGSLTEERIGESIKESLEALGVSQVNTLFVHMPDPVTPIEETAKAFDEAYSNGHFQLLGLSNYTAPQIIHWHTPSVTHNLIAPAIYQGQYNLLCRRPETDLFPTLRKHGMHFHAYSPLAGGFLSGKPTKGDTAGTRFEKGNRMGEMHQGWYDMEVMHEGVWKLDEFIKRLGLSLTEVAMRWLMFHSDLKEGDGIIIGGSRLEHIGANVDDVWKGRLPEGVLRVVDEIWEMVRGEAP